MIEIVGEECKDQGHAWDAKVDWWLVHRWVGRGQTRRWRRIAERRASCQRGDCGAVAIDRASPDLSRMIAKRYIYYTNPEYLGQTLGGRRVTRHSARLWRARQQGELAEQDQS